MQFLESYTHKACSQTNATDWYGLPVMTSMSPWTIGRLNNHEDCVPKEVATA